jgi:hypothetical protein
MSMTAGLFMASFICERNMGFSISSRSCDESGGGPIYSMLAQVLTICHVVESTYTTIWTEHVRARQSMKTRITRSR